MNLESLAYAGQILTALAVAVSLVYLATQVRQTKKSQQAENYGRALDRLSAMQARLSENAGLGAIFERVIVDPTRATRDERVQASWALYEMFGALEFMFHQHEDGMLPAHVWERWEAALAWWLSFPGVQAWWRARPTPFSRAFTDLVDRLAATRPVAPATTARWREFVRGAASS